MTPGDLRQKRALDLLARLRSAAVLQASDTMIGSTMGVRHVSSRQRRVQLRIKTRDDYNLNVLAKLVLTILTHPVWRQLGGGD